MLPRYRRPEGTGSRSEKKRTPGCTLCVPNGSASDAHLRQGLPPRLRPRIAFLPGSRPARGRVRDRGSKCRTSRRRASGSFPRPSESLRARLPRSGRRSCSGASAVLPCRRCAGRAACSCRPPRAAPMRVSRLVLRMICDREAFWLPLFSDWRDYLDIQK